MRRTFYLLMAMAVGSASCGSSDSTATTSPTSSPTTTVTTLLAVPESTATTVPAPVIQPEPAPEPVPTITVSGRGVAYGVPDRVTADLLISVIRPTAHEATQVAGWVAENVRSALLAEGVERRDIQTSDYGISSEWDYPRNEPKVFVGFRVRHSYRVEMPLTAAGSIIDAAMANSWDALEVHGTILSIDDPSDFVAEARDAAWDDCVATAEELATKAGLALGPVLRIEEGTSISTPGYPYGANGDGAGYIEPGRIAVTSMLEVEFATKPPAAPDDNGGTA
jgi:uncharacterized protein YggE